MLVPIFNMKTQLLQRKPETSQCRLAVFSSASNEDRVLHLDQHFAVTFCPSFFCIPTNEQNVVVQLWVSQGSCSEWTSVSAYIQEDLDMFCHLLLYKVGDFWKLPFSHHVEPFVNQIVDQDSKKDEQQNDHHC